MADKAAAATILSTDKNAAKRYATPRGRRGALCRAPPRSPARPRPPLSRSSAPANPALPQVPFGRHAAARRGRDAATTARRSPPPPPSRTSSPRSTSPGRHRAQRLHEDGSSTPCRRQRASCRRECAAAEPCAIRVIFLLSAANPGSGARARGGGRDRVSASARARASVTAGGRAARARARATQRARPGQQRVLLRSARASRPTSRPTPRPTSPRAPSPCAPAAAQVRSSRHGSLRLRPGVRRTSPGIRDGPVSSPRRPSHNYRHGRRHYHPVQ